MEPLYVITAISNPKRFKSRYKLYKDFEKRCLDAGAILYTAECAFGDRPFEITKHDNPRHIQVRAWDELWIKESLLNLTLHRLPVEAEYIAWVDADVLFARPDWVEETVHQLQHYMVVQMFDYCQDLSPDHSVLNPKEFNFNQIPSMFYQYLNGGSATWKSFSDNYPYGRHPGHCGYAWAARRETLDILGGLIDWSICGSNDEHMARGLMGEIESSIHGEMSNEFKQSMKIWETKASKLLKDIGYVPGLIFHHWHGKKKNRGYVERWKILVENKFNPYEDIQKNTQGIWQLTGNKPKLRDQIRQYFADRNEDSIDVE